MMTKPEFTTPILFLIFNRPDLTSQVFDQIASVKPKKLYIASDGPRNKEEGEDPLVQQTRDLVLNRINWDCDVKTLFRDENLGCKVAVSSAIDWFFENVEEGIILEDDCLPDQSFFYFCAEMLDLYRNTEKIMHISGFNFENITKNMPSSYFFSRHGVIWGWATWKRAWQKYDVDIKSWPSIKAEKKYKHFLTKTEIPFRIETWDKIVEGLLDTWDYQWSFARLINKGLNIVPKENLIRNIGFRCDALHTKNAPPQLTNIKLNKLNFPLIHPTILKSNSAYNKRYESFFLKKNSYHIYVKKLKKLCNRIIKKFKNKHWNINQHSYKKTDSGSYNEKLPHNCIEEFEIIITKKYSGILLDLFKSLTKIQGLQIFLHGSFADNTANAFSDIDDFIIIDDAHLKSKEYNKIIKKLNKIDMKFCKIDPLQHHGHFTILTSELTNYNGSPIPLFILKNATLIHGRNKINAQINKLETQGNCKTTIIKHCKAIENLFKKYSERKINLYELKWLISAIALMPAIIFQYKGLNYTKPEAIKKSINLFTTDSLKLIEVATTYRKNWHQILNTRSFKIFKILPLFFLNPDIWRKFSRKFSPKYNHLGHNKNMFTSMDISNFIKESLKHIN